MPSFAGDHNGYRKAVIAVQQLEGVADVVLITKPEGGHPRAQSAQAEGIFRARLPAKPSVPSARGELEARPVRPSDAVRGEPEPTGAYDALTKVLAGPEAWRD